jgi:FKBP-type peptidyl-prolyl cis-trans isomerase SlpA
MIERRIQPGDRVTLHYRLASLGQEIANTFLDAPETFRIGANEIDSHLEKVLIDLLAGTHKTLQLTPSEAFGERDETLIQALPRSDFPADLPIGHQVEFGLPNGETWLGTVIDIEPDSVQIDFNPPLAGLPIEFEIHILAIDHDQ